MALNPDKVQFALPEVTFSGYRVYSSGYCISEDIVQGLTDFLPPKVWSEL